jgi:hypothetical protein
MGSRKQAREPLALSISVCGTDTKGRAFMERVETANISRDGAFLEGIEHQLRNNDVVVIRCGGNTDRFRVIWQQAAGEGEGIRMGLVRVTPLAAAGDEVQGDFADEYMRPRQHARRQHLRGLCAVAAELRVKDSEIPMWATTINLCEGGCAIDAPIAVPVSTQLNVALWLDRIKIWAQAVVVSSQYGYGTGIQFTSMSRQDQHRLREFVNRCPEPLPERRGQEVVRHTILQSFASEPLDQRQAELARRARAEKQGRRGVLI